MKLCECGCGKPAPIAPQTVKRRGWLNGQPMRFVRGHAARLGLMKLQHGMSRTPEYRAYRHAKERCTNSKNKSWPNYGGRGIKFLFTNFEQFIAELGPRPTGKSLDRIENDGNYEPGNVRWATPTEQSINQRKGTPAQIASLQKLNRRAA
jgi:hypothetical protein